MTDNYAVISDIHGNSWALKAVLDDIKNRGISNIINLGDSFYGPLDPRGTADILLGIDALTISGNQDRQILEAAGQQDLPPITQFVLDQFETRHIDWLKPLPPTKIIDDELFLFHGTPDDDSTYFLEEVGNESVSLKKRYVIEKSLKNHPYLVYLCGHSHVPSVVNISRNRIIVNPGSVGLPAYTDVEPVFHKMESGSPHAKYAVIAKSDGYFWKAELIRVSYDWEKVSAVAKNNGREDWAAWILIGKG